MTNGKQTNLQAPVLVVNTEPQPDDPRSSTDDLAPSIPDAPLIIPPLIRQIGFYYASASVEIQNALNGQNTETPPTPSLITR